MNSDLIWAVLFFILGIVMYVIGGIEAIRGHMGWAVFGWAMSAVDFVLAYSNLRSFIQKRKDRIEG